MTQQIIDSYMPYDSGAGANVTSVGWRQFAKYFTGDGVKRAVANGFNVFGDSTGMHVKVDTGEVQIQGQWGKISSTKTLAIANNSTGANRLDMVVVRNDFVNSYIVIDVLTGSSSTTPPVVTQNTSIWEVQLAIVTVPNGAVTITSGNVKFAPSVADNFIGGQYRGTTSATESGSGTVVAQTQSMLFQTGQTYRVTGWCQWNASNGNIQNWNLQLKLATAGTVILLLPIQSNSSQANYGVIIGIMAISGAPISDSIQLILTGPAGGATGVAQVGTSIIVERVGPNAIMSSV